MATGSKAPHCGPATRVRRQPMGNVTRAVHSGQEVINPGRWSVLPLARRCHVGSPQVRRRNTTTSGAPGSCSPSTRRPTRRRPRVHPSADDGRHSPPVPSDTLATGGQQGNQRRTSPAADALEIRRTFVASRLSAVYLAAAYAQVVPRHRRRMGLTEIRQSPFAEAAEKRTAGEGRGNS
jgi:hypothetical protein